MKNGDLEVIRNGLGDPRIIKVMVFVCTFLPSYIVLKVSASNTLKNNAHQRSALTTGTIS